MNIAVTLDTTKPDKLMRIRLRKGEVASTVLDLVVYEGGTQLDLNDYSKVRFCAQKDDGIIIDEVQVAEDGTAVYSLPAGIASMAGTVTLAYLALYNEGYIVTTQCIVFDVLEAVDEAEAVASYVPMLDDLADKLNELNDAVQAAEGSRKAAETARGDAESKRVTAEGARADAEKARATAESSRATAEKARATAETARGDAEKARADAESKRVTAESARVSAESKRVTAESARVTAENGRVDAEAKRVADFAEMIDTAQGVKVRICAEGEYDAETWEPTLSGVAGVIYLVPSADPTDDDSYAEWIVISGKWEKIGGTGATFSPIPTPDIDSIASGTTATGNEVLNKTGLSYLWTKIKAAFSAVGHKHAASDVTSGTFAAARIPDLSGTYALKAKGVPDGGSAGQLLTKAASGFAWADAPSGLPDGGEDGQVLTKDGGAAAWKDLPRASLPGAIVPFAGGDVPEGWLACDGSAVSRTGYAALFGTIGTTWGKGDGSTTFNLPDLRGRFPLGSSGSYAIGATGGEETHTLTPAEMPAHSHAINVYEHKNNGGAKSVHRTQWTDANDANPAKIRTDVIGETQPHNNMPPYAAMGYIISTGDAVDVNEVVQGVGKLPLEVGNGGTGATSAAQARANLGLPEITVGTADPPATGTPGSVYIKLLGDS